MKCKKVLGFAKGAAYMAGEALIEVATTVATASVITYGVEGWKEKIEKERDIERQRNDDRDR